MDAHALLQVAQLAGGGVEGPLLLSTEVALQQPQRLARHTAATIEASRVLPLVDDAPVAVEVPVLRRSNLAAEAGESFQRDTVGGVAGIGRVIGGVEDVDAVAEDVVEDAMRRRRMVEPVRQRLVGPLLLGRPVTGRVDLDEGADGGAAAGDLQTTPLVVLDGGAVEGPLGVRVGAGALDEQRVLPDLSDRRWVRVGVGVDQDVQATTRALVSNRLGGGVIGPALVGGTVALQGDDRRC